MPYRFGSHVSCQGGLLAAIDRAAAIECDVMQVFVSSPQKWATVATLFPVTPASKTERKPDSCLDSQLFVDALERTGIGAPIAHASYLINMASPDEELWKKSRDALVIEWQRAEQLKLEGLVVHPGAHLKATPEEGVARVVQMINEATDAVAPRYCRLLLENTAGQGSCLGHSIEQLGQMIKESAKPASLGVCWDTCHALAAGYDFRTAAGLKEMVAKIEAEIGLENLRAVHINDSKKDCGSRVDRHEHIGLGFIGEAGFKRFLACSAFKKLPMYLETAKEKDEASGEEWDVINLRTLRRLCK